MVLYKLDAIKAPTVNSLLKVCHKLNDIGCKLVIWDNSPVGQDLNQLHPMKSSFNNFCYNHTPENIALSKIYNRVLINNIDYQYLILFDQDSQLNWDFFNKHMIASTSNPEINLFLPIIKSNNTIVSPADRKIITGKYWKKKILGIVKAKNRLAITSGMVISIDYLEKKGKPFNEKLDLYGIDNDFMINYEKENEHFFVLDYNLTHDLSIHNIEEFSKKLFRFRNHRKSLYIIYENEGLLKKVCVRLYALISSLRMAAKYRSIEFLKYRSTYDR